MSGTYNGKMLVLVGGVAIASLVSSKMSFDNAQTAEDVASGTAYNQMFAYAGAAKANATIDWPWTNAAAAAGLCVATPPAPFILKTGWLPGPRGFQFAAAWLNDVTITGKPSSYISCSSAVVGVGKPTAGLTVSGTISQPKPPQFKDIVFTTAVGTTVNLKGFTIKLTNTLILDYTNSGDEWIAEAIPGPQVVTGTIDLKAVSDAEAAIVLAACQTPATMGCAIAAVCGSDAATFTLNNGIYKMLDRTGSKNAATMDKISFFCITPDGGTTKPLVIS